MSDTRPGLNDLEGNPVRGIFWSPTSPERKVAGELSHDGRQFVIDLAGCAVPSVRMVKSAQGLMFQQSGYGIAVDHMPQVLHGSLETGRDITLLDAQMTMELPWGAPPTQRFTGWRLVHGAHVDPNTPVTGVRFTMNVSPRAGWMTQEPESSALGHISAWSADDLPGFEVDLTNPIAVAEAADRLPARLAGLLQLALNSDVVPVRREVRLADGGWLPCGHHETVQRQDRGDIFEPDEMTLTHMARWADVAQALGRYPAVAASDVAPLEIAAQVYTTALEGLGRALAVAVDTPRVPTRVRKKARDAAIEAATRAISELTQISPEDAALHREYRDALAHVGEPTYTTRVRTLLTPVYEVVPALFGGDLERWMKQAKDIRNDESHGLDSIHELAADDLGRYIVMSRTARWAMRIRMLQTIFTPEDLRPRLGRSTSFWQLLGNVDADMFWQGYSCTNDFARGNRVRAALAGLSEPTDGWPLWVWHAPRQDAPPSCEAGVQPPYEPEDLSYVRAFLALHGRRLPQVFEGADLSSSTVSYKTWEERQDLDVVLITTHPEATDTHVGIVIGDQVLHHCPESGQPVAESYDDAATTKRCPHVIGLITVLETS